MGLACWISRTTRTHAHAHAPLYPHTHTHTHTHTEICNSYCFSTATMVSRTRLNVTSYVHCLSCFKLPRLLFLLFAHAQSELSLYLA
jgi:Pyruvate/2-oxoacid:ferredoxin oxidoreductase delta subunit